MNLEKKKEENLEYAFVLKVKHIYLFIENASIFLHISVRKLIRSIIRLLKNKTCSCLAISDINKMVRYISLFMFIACTAMFPYYSKRDDQWYCIPIIPLKGIRFVSFVDFFSPSMCSLCSMPCAPHDSQKLLIGFLNV